MTQVVPAGSPGALEEAIRILRRGGVIAFPTDTVYGLGCLVGDRTAIDRLFEMKGRGRQKAIPVLTADLSDLARVAEVVPPAANRLARRFWPGPLTLIVPRRPDLPLALGPEPTVGVRVPDHEFARDLLRGAGPMAVTSANPSGAPNALTADEVRAGLRHGLDLILDGGPAPGGLPSTVVDCVSAPPRLLRAGPIAVEDLRSIIPELSDGERG